MLTLDAATDLSKPGLKSRFYQYRQFLSDDEAEAIRDSHSVEGEREHREELFLLRGRPNQILSITDGETFRSRSRIHSKKGVEHWEVNAQESLPMRAGALAMMGARQPCLRPAMADVKAGVELGDALSSHLDSFAATTRVSPLGRDDADAFLVSQTFDGGECVHSVVLRSDDPNTLPGVVSRMGLEPESASNLGERLRGD